MYKRSIEDLFLQSFTSARSVFITGPHQSGKTTLMKQWAEKLGGTFVSMEDPQQFAAAQDDPMAYVSNLKGPVFIDEVHRVHALSGSIKYSIDQNKKKFVLASSVNRLGLYEWVHASVGRAAWMELQPLSEGERLGNYETFLSSLFAAPDSFEPQHGAGVAREDMVQKILAGSFSIKSGNGDAGRIEWFRSFEQKALRELMRLDETVDTAAIMKLLRVVATHNMKPINIPELVYETGLPAGTIDRYLVLLKKAYFVDFLVPYLYLHDMKVPKAFKLLFSDTGYLNYLLGFQENNLLSNDVFFEQMLKNFVISELLKQSTWNDTRMDSYFHFRTRGGHGLDLIINRRPFQLVGIKIIGRDTILPEDFSQLKTFAGLKERLTIDKWLRGVILYPGDKVHQFDEHLFAVPISTLWEMGHPIARQDAQEEVQL